MSVCQHLWFQYFQVFSISFKDELRREEACLDGQGTEGKKVQLMPCHGGHGNQEWIHDKVTVILQYICITGIGGGGLSKTRVVPQYCKNTRYYTGHMTKGTHLLPKTLSTDLHIGSFNHNYASFQRDNTFRFSLFCRFCLDNLAN